MTHTSTARLLQSAEDMLQSQKIRCIAFGYSFDPATYEYKGNDGLSESWGAGEPMSSTLVVHDFGTWFDGHLVSTTGIGGVASLPEGRGQGGIRDIFAALLPAWREKDVVFSTLYPFSHVFYRKFGYELVQRLKRYTLPMAALSLFPASLPVRLVTDFNELLQLHRDFGRQNNLAILRKDAQWHWVSRDPYKTMTYTYLVGDSAYVTFSKQEAGPGEDLHTVRVMDLAFRDAAALRELFGFLYSLRAQYGKVILPLPDSVPLMDMIPECYEAKLEVSQQGMARIVNVQRALELMRYPQEAGAFCVQVDDAFCPVNSGLYVVRYEGGAATSVAQDRFGDRPDLKVSVQRLTQLVLGSLTLDEALYLPDVECLVSPERLRSIFVKKDIFFTDGF